VLSVFVSVSNMGLAAEGYILSRRTEEMVPPRSPSGSIMVGSSFHCWPSFARSKVLFVCPPA